MYTQDVTEQRKHFFEKSELIEQLELHIKEKEKLEQELIQQANTDSLTGLYNRRYIESLLEREVMRAERYGNPLSIMLIDIDLFKQVNDTHGHSVGDRVLQHFASMINSYVRETDVVSRWGGEEFLVVLPEISLHSAIIFAERFRHLVEQELFPEVNSLSASIGIAAFVKRDTSLNLFNKADSALYRAKNSGRNKVSY